MSRIPEGNSIKSWFWQYTTQKNSPSSGKNLTYSSFIRKQTKQLEKKATKVDNEKLHGGVIFRKLKT